MRTLLVPSAAPQRIGVDERTAITAAVSALLDTGPYIGGPAVAAFEEQFAAHVGRAHAIGVDNGSNALTIALLSLGIETGGVVLVPANDGGFAAAASQAAGLVPVVADVDNGTALVTVETLEAARMPRTAAVIVTHLHGLVADMAPIVAWCRQRDVALLEDCAQAHGARRDGVPAGASGDVATFSFYPTKNLAALGDAGGMVTDRPDVAERARLLRQNGWEPRFRVVDRRGRNSRLDALQAAILSARLPFLERNNDARRAILRRYRRAAPTLTFLGGNDCSHVVHHAVARSARRDALRARLLAQGIGVDVHYPFLVQEMPGIVTGAPASTPHADALRREVLSLPCFPEMTADEIDIVCDALMRWCADES